jgi:GDP-L-fucose synthase
MTSITSKYFNYMYQKILVTGGSGLVGKYLKKILPNAIYVSSKDYDLTIQDEVKKMYEQHKPDCVVHLAARVGGIFDNIHHPFEYFDQNILMNTFMVKYAQQYGVKKFIGILSSCIFPDVVETYPMKEEDLHLGPPTRTNFSYGMAKRALAVQIESCNEEYGTE